MNKKIVALLSTVILLAGCSSQPKTNDTKASNETKVEQSAAKKAELNKAVSFKNYDVTITNVEKAKDEMDQDALKVTYTFKNKSAQKVSPMMANTFNVKQGDVELTTAAVKDPNAGLANESIDKDAEVKECVAYFTLDKNKKDIAIEIVPFVGENEKAKIDVKYAELKQAPEKKQAE